MTAKRAPGMPPPMPRTRAPAATPAPAIQEAIDQMPYADYADDDCTEIDGPDVAKKWLDSIETIPFDPSMRVFEASGSLLGEGTPPRAVAPVRVDRPVDRTVDRRVDRAVDVRTVDVRADRADVRADATPRRPERRAAQVRADGTPRPRRGTPAPQRPVARHPNDNVVTRAMHIDVAGGRVSFTPDPEHDIQPLAAPPPPPQPLYGAPALPPHVSTAMAVPPQAVMPTQIAQPLPAQLPTQVAQSLPALVRPYKDGVTPYPVPPWATGQHGAALAPAVAHSAVQPHAPAQPRYAVPSAVSHDHLAIYADTDERHADTLRVAALPALPAPSLRPSLTRFLVPMIGGVALVVFVAGYFLVRGDHAPAPPPVAAAAAPIAHAAPIVEPIAEPTVEQVAAPQLPPPSWKERDAKPTIVAAAPAAEAAAPAAHAPADDEAAETSDAIEMAPMVATKPTRPSRSSSRRAKRAQVAVAAPVRATKATTPAKAIAAPTAKVTAARTAKTRDPILEEIERPAKAAQAKATGPGKLAVSSSVPTLIYIDGRSTNLMTPKTLNLAPGTHKITLLELSTRKAKTVDVEIASGAVARLDKKF